jgi:hypothetical protein
MGGWLYDVAITVPARVIILFEDKVEFSTVLYVL